VYLLGGASGVAQMAASRLRAAHPGLVVVGAASPRVDVEEPAARRMALVEGIRAAEPDLILVALGAPKQELWIHDTAAALRPAVLVGVGASLDFIAGTARRAPKWMSAAGLEWAYRLAHEPRRLWRRYLVRDPEFVGIFVQQLMAHWSARGEQT
jgi:N-acetylglucosaminyldiphosphoundecaprenol N-acetyl-beta-D-mannosaminyltransferase